MIAQAEALFQMGEDKNGLYMDSQLKLGDYPSEITRTYYKNVDEMFLQTMPDDIFYKLVDMMNKEVARRNK